MTAVSNVAIDVEMNINEILQMLNEESQQQEEFEVTSIFKCLICFKIG